MIPLLFAQVVAPPTQQGPIRLPGPGAVQGRPSTQTSPTPLDLDPAPIGPAAPEGSKDPSESPSSSKPPSPSASRLPYPVTGASPYSAKTIAAILEDCVTVDDCAAKLRARLLEDGYINSQVIVETMPAALQVRIGRIEKLSVTGSDRWLNRRIQRLLGWIQNKPLHLPMLEQQIRLLQLQPGVKSVKAALTPVDQDPRRAELSLKLEPGAQPLRGEFTARNDGTSGSGEYRGTGVLLKNALILPGDTLLFYGELSGTDSPEVGAVVGSVSYTFPLADTIGLTAAYGYNRQTPVELAFPLDEFTNKQLQGQLQLEWTFRETLSERWSFAAGLISNRNNLNFDGKPLPPTLPSVTRNPRTGYFRFGVNGSGLSGPVAWNSSVFLLQGINGMTPQDQQQDLATFGIVPDEATAIGALVSANWSFAPSWQLNLRAGGQVAFQPLTLPMRFSLGSDVGIRGLPGQLVSGDNAWLGTGELVWTFWQKKQQALQLVPFIGGGGVYTELPGEDFSDVLGSAGLLARWIAGENFSLELGYAHSFNTDNNPGPWTDWSLGNGLYAKASFRF